MFDALKKKKRNLGGGGGECSGEIYHSTMLSFDLEKTTLDSMMAIKHKLERYCRFLVSNHSYFSLGLGECLANLMQS